MKRKSIYVLSLISLLSFSILSSCGEKKVECDEMFEDCDGSDDNNNQTDVVLDADTNSNYTFETVDNSKGSVSYEIFIRSFYDSDGDGVGDLNGVKEKLPYLKDLGINNIWLMPMNPSPTYHGYDISNYYDIDPEYGTLADFDSLVAEAKKNGISITMDLVINHCSIQNEYFTTSYKDYKDNNTSETSKKDWFNWTTDVGYQGYNKYYDTYYESRFDGSMPDLNLSSSGVKKEIEKIIKFWIDHGVLGFRLDAVLFYYYNSTTDNVAFLTWLNGIAKKYNEKSFLVGECWTGQQTIEEYYKSGCESFFTFPASNNGNSNLSIIGATKNLTGGDKFGAAVEDYEKTIKVNNPKAYSSYFLSNHDMDRISNNFTDDELYKLGASITYLLPGTPYMYYGEEISLKGVRKTYPDDQSDVKRRLPMIWERGNNTGLCSFPDPTRLDLDNTAQVVNGVKDQLDINYSLLNHYKKVINIRNKYPFIKDAIFTNQFYNLQIKDTGMICYELSDDNNKILVVHNTSRFVQTIDVSKLSDTILDSINLRKLKPKLEAGKLSLAGLSSVVLNIK